MTMVTDEMVQAARRCMPARWSMDDLRNAIAAAIDATPPFELAFLEPGHISETDVAKFQQTWDEIVAASDPEAPLPLVRVLPGHIEIHEPELHPALDHPLVLGGISEIAAQLEVARSTVVGWIKRAEKIAMPGPIATLAAGPVFDLTAVEAWYRTWKAETIGDNSDGGR